MTIAKEDLFRYLSGVLAGITGGTIFGMIGFGLGIDYGGNYGCFSLVDAIFGTRGYESCGAFGAVIGILMGIIVVPLFLVLLVSLNPDMSFNYNDFSIFPFIFLIFVLLSLVPSIIITLFMRK